jgi:signal recognition particle subunit SEC65
MDEIEIAGKLGRSAASITKRLRDLGLNQLNTHEKRKPRVSWEISDLVPSHEASSGGGLRG